MSDPDVPDPDVSIRCLSECPDAVPAIADRYFDEWGYQSPEATREDVLAEVARGLDTTALPVTFVALATGRPVGAAQLKLREMPRYAAFEHWLGGVYVDPSRRGSNLASRLVRRCIDEAVARGLRTLYLQTARLDGGLYARLGWRAVERTEEAGRTVLIMARSIGRPATTAASTSLAVRSPPRRTARRLDRGE